MVYWPGIAGLVEAVGDAIDVIEVEPQPFWFAPRSNAGRYRIDLRAFEHLRRLPQPKIVHGVGFPIGGTAGPTDLHLEPFAASIAALDAAWASEHLSFNRVRRGECDVDVGFLLPPVQSPESVALAAANIRTVTAHLPVPFAFETGVSYLQPASGEMSDGAYFAAVAEAADCGILLDLHNVWANERNGRQAVLDLVDELPLDRVWEIHVAGGQELDGLWVDAHSGLAPSPVLDLARDIVPRLPNLKAIVFEIMPEYAVESGLSPEDLLDQLRELRQIWDVRGTAVARAGAQAAAPKPATPPSMSPRAATGTPPTPTAWEETLAAAVSGAPMAGTALADRLARDPGVGVLRRLVGSVRAGKIATALRLTTRLLLLTLGENGVQDLFDEFWRTVPSELTASEEGRRFASFLQRDRPSGVPFLAEVLTFEVAALQALIDGEAQVVRFGCDVSLVVTALRDGRLPTTVPRGDYEVTIPPPAGAVEARRSS